MIIRVKNNNCKVSFNDLQRVFFESLGLELLSVRFEEKECICFPAEMLEELKIFIDDGNDYEIQNWIEEMEENYKL